MMGKLVKCIMCYGIDKETQERLKDRKPVSDCHLCDGTGVLEVEFKKGLEQNECRVTGKTGDAGYPIVQFSAGAEKP
jgi:hypothetical protein